MELKGSKTEKNLRAAFSGESMARNKYSYFADVAKKEGLEQIAEVFSETAENERVHARKELEFLGGISDTKTNLKTAAEGEHQEWTKMYAEFEQIARQEGFSKIADFFKGVAEVEKQHDKRYLALLKDVKDKTVLKKDKKAVWKCSSCGWVKTETDAPVECPTCQAPQSSFKVSSSIFY